MEHRARSSFQRLVEPTAGACSVLHAHAPCSSGYNQGVDVIVGQIVCRINPVLQPRHTVISVKGSRPALFGWRAALLDETIRIGGDSWAGTPQ